MSSHYATELASCFDGSDETTLGLTDGEMCARALRYYARRKNRHIRRLHGVCIAALAAVLLSPTAFALMDLDGDGEVTSIDAHFALNYLTEGTTTARRFVHVNGQRVLVEVTPTSAPGVDYAIRTVDANMNLALVSADAAISPTIE